MFGLGTKHGTMGVIIPYSYPMVKVVGSY